MVEKLKILIWYLFLRYILRISILYQSDPKEFLDWSFCICSSCNIRKSFHEVLHSSDWVHKNVHNLGFWIRLRILITFYFCSREPRSVFTFHEILTFFSFLLTFESKTSLNIKCLSTFFLAFFIHQNYFYKIMHLIHTLAAI